ncbi:MAG: cation:proton antiporter [Methanomicrobiales archaeon]|jgi:multicomponent Na+:H+ antiporter subunit F|nr:cation:proton antiporter [Methanomicrobiales archaeon]
MIDIWALVLGLLLLFVVGAMIRLWLGPTSADRAVALDAVNTITVCAIIVFGVAFNETVFVDVAIVYALLSFVGTLWLARYIGGDL